MKIDRIQTLLNEVQLTKKQSSAEKYLEGKKTK